MDGVGRVAGRADQRLLAFIDAFGEVLDFGRVAIDGVERQGFFFAVELVEGGRAVVGGVTSDGNCSLLSARRGNPASAQWSGMQGG